MKAPRFLNSSRGLVLLQLMGVLFSGCGGKEETAPSQSATAVTPQSGASAVSAPTAPPVVRTPSATAADEQLRASQAAQQARDYEKAAEALVLLQQQQRLNEQQAALVQQQMRQLQTDLATAIARGDPRAKAAAERLRRSATVR